MVANRPGSLRTDRFIRFIGPTAGSGGSKPVQCKNSFLIEPNRFIGRSKVRPVGPAGPVSKTLVFTHNIYGRKPQIPDGMSDPSVPLTLEFFAYPRYPPSISYVAPAPDPAAVSKEECLENSPTAAGEEATLPMGLLASSNGGVKDAIVN